MPDLVNVSYAQTGESKSTNEMGMRDMQARAFEARNSQYILLKAPPASGKSRALMFLGLDKLHHQKLDKVIVCVPEKSIGGSFSSTNLSDYGFFADWYVKSRYNLCVAGNDNSKGKIKTFHEFLESNAQILICTHATFRFACEDLDDGVFDSCLVAIDEFHHVSADANNRLGEALRSIMVNSSAHIIAMTGSYFRGDSAPVLTPEIESQFSHVTYNYYEQLNGYEFLKSLGIGYHFYQGSYLGAVDEVLDTDKKTILHIPNVNAGESTKDKYEEVNTILGIIGDVVSQDPKTGIIDIKRKSDGRIIKVADLVEEEGRDRVIEYLRNIKIEEDMDLIIALGMAKEGFDWAYCEHSLTIGYRGSLTEIIQIIGRCTRDSRNKSHAQFTNLIAQPDADDDDVKISVNNMLKAITCSLLMEQVLAPTLKFKAKITDEEKADAGTIKIKGFKEPSTQRVKEITENDINDIKVQILQDKTIQKTMAVEADPEVINKVLIPKIIQEKYPDLSAEEVTEVSQHIVVDSVLKSGDIKETGDKRFIRMAGKFINIDDLHIDLIQSVNPFHDAFEILSKSVNVKTLKLIQDSIEATRINMTEEEAKLLWPKVNEFFASKGRHPNINSLDAIERRLAEVVIYLKNQRRKHGV
jgi:hypothetical protein